MDQEAEQEGPLRVAARWALRALVVLVVISTGLAAWWAWPKSEPLPLNPRTFTGFYRGFGPAGCDTDPLFGKRYYRVRIADKHGHTDVFCSKPGYNYFVGYYSSGQLREEGKCLVELTGFEDYPLADRHTVEWGKYYKPDGSLGSEIKDGTGVQVYWNLKGARTWELELKSFKRVRLAYHAPDGQLLIQEAYKEGVLHGRSVWFYSSGAKKMEGIYSMGERTGKWTYYNEGGSVQKVEDCGDATKAPSSDGAKAAATASAEARP